MVRFIYACGAIIILSFIAIPVFNGISKEHALLSEAEQANAGAPDDTLSFAEIYALADEGSEPNADNLNNITPAAGDDVTEDGFSRGFEGKADSALEDTPQDPVIDAPAKTETP